MDTSSKGLVVSEELLEIRWNQTVVQRVCRVSYDLRDGVRISTEPWIITSEPLPSLDDRYSVRAQNGEPFEAFATRIPRSWSETGWRAELQLVPKLEPVLIHKASPVRSVKFAIPNFGHFISQRPGHRAIRNHIDLPGGGWSFHIGLLGELELGDLSAAESYSFTFTHSGTLTRDDGLDFTPLEARHALAAIGDFLTFCRGRLISPALVEGFDAEGHKVMQEWGSGRIEPYTECATWLDRNQAQEMAYVFPGFLKRTLDPEWREVLRECIYWYSRTNTAAAGVDGALVLIQAALESLAWRLLVQHHKVLSAHGFEKLPAADHLRLLMDRCSIPLTIPEGLEALHRAAAKTWSDGPEAVVEIRNRVVHPPKKASGSSNKKGSGVYWDAWRLGAWYLELAILRLVGFNGKYANRTNKHLGSVEAVPWAAFDPANI